MITTLYLTNCIVVDNEQNYQNLLIACNSSINFDQEVMPSNFRHKADQEVELPSPFHA